MELLNQVLEIVKEAAKFCKREEVEVYCKEGNSNFVTTADLNVENFLKEKLLELLPDSGFVGEESEAKDYEKPLQWIVDPVDGTANFIRELNLSAISVGLVEHGEAILGVVYNPFTDEAYYAQKGKGAYLNGTPIHVSDRDFSHAQFCVGFCLYDKTKADACFRIFERVYMECDDMRRLGAASVELAALAAGKTDMFFEIRLSPWDYAAAVAIITEAGGYIGSREGAPIRFDKQVTVIAANSKENFDKLVAIADEEMEGMEI